MLSQKDGASARIQKEELEKEEIMFVGVPAGIITALLVLLAAFLVALIGQVSGKAMVCLPSALSAFVIHCLYFTCTCNSFVPVSVGR